jgi:hypothetical protein
MDVKSSFLIFHCDVNSLPGTERQYPASVVFCPMNIPLLELEYISVILYLSFITIGRKFLHKKIDSHVRRPTEYMNYNGNTIQL